MLFVRSPRIKTSRTVVVAGDDQHIAFGERAPEVMARQMPITEIAAAQSRSEHQPSLGMNSWFATY